MGLLIGCLEGWELGCLEGCAVGLLMGCREGWELGWLVGKAIMFPITTYAVPLLTRPETVTSGAPMIISG